jgi:23S rRNA (guanosine2251-2'-O)-methyltransferase
MERRQKIRMRSKSHFIYGTRAVIESIDSGQEIEKVLIQKDVRNELIQQLKTKLKHHNIPYQQVPREKLFRLTRKNHQGVICFLSPIQYRSLDNVVESSFAEGRDPFLAILDRVTDVRNFGAIARTLECAGIDALVIESKGNAMIGADAVKTSAGALNILPVCRESNLKSTIGHLKKSGLTVIACTEKTDLSIFESDLTGPIAIIFGSEENGISDEILDLCDASVKIPMSGKIDSLNVSVTAGIAIYEAVRQRQLA